MADIRLLQVLGCCHSLQNIGDVMRGDTMELELFKNSGFRASTDRGILETALAGGVISPDQVVCVCMYIHPLVITCPTIR